jgi:putative membrane protein
VAGPVVAAALVAEVQVEAGRKESGRPSWFPSKVSDMDLKKISEAVHLAEKTTTGEIVPMIVRSSTSFGHVPMTLTLALFSCLLFLEVEMISYFSEFSQVPQWIIAPVLLVACYFISIPLSKSAWICRCLTPNRDEIAAVELRAEIEFHRGRFGNTEKSSAVLIFVSMMEHRAVVLADKGIAEKIDGKVWDEINGLLLAGLKKGEFVQGWQAAIARAGTLLTEHFPLNGKAKNEISNDLVIKN